MDKNTTITTTQSSNGFFYHSASSSLRIRLQFLSEMSASQPFPKGFRGFHVALIWCKRRECLVIVLQQFIHTLGGGEEGTEVRRRWRWGGDRGPDRFLIPNPLASENTQTNDSQLPHFLYSKRHSSAPPSQSKVSVSNHCIEVHVAPFRPSWWNAW